MVRDSLMSPEDREEALSKAYVLAVTGAAGFSTAEYDFDRSGTDLLVQGGGDFSPMLALQLKATVNLRPLRATGGGDVQFSTQIRKLRLVEAPHYGSSFAGCSGPAVSGV